MWRGKNDEEKSRVSTCRYLENEEILSRLVEDRATAQVQVINNRLVTRARLSREMTMKLVLLTLKFHLKVTNPLDYIRLIGLLGDCSTKEGIAFQ